MSETVTETGVDRSNLPATDGCEIKPKVLGARVKFVGNDYASLGEPICIPWTPELQDALLLAA